MAGTEPYQDGEIEKGLNTVIGYFAQSQADELNSPTRYSVETATIGNDDANRAALGAYVLRRRSAQENQRPLRRRKTAALAKMLMPKPAA